MLAEFLTDRGGWTQVMPGARACLFSLREGPLSLPLRLEPLHFEALFCLVGSMTLTRRDGSTLTAGARQVLLLTDLSSLTAVRVASLLEGILVAVDARNARESLQTICGLLGNLSLDTGQVRRWMAGRGGCTVEGPTYHLHPEPPGLPLRHHLQGELPPPVRPAGPRLATATADGTGGGVVAQFLPQCAGGGTVGGVQ